MRRAVNGHRATVGRSWQTGRVSRPDPPSAPCPVSRPDPPSALGPVRRHASARSLAALAGVALLVTAGLVVRHRLEPKHFEVVEAGVLYRSATLPPSQLVEVTREYGIRTVVNLRSPEENAEPWHAAQRAALAAADVAMIDLPMAYGTPPAPELEARWLALLADPDAQPILVHCQYGVLRTGIMVSVFDLAHRGASPDGLFDRGPKFGHGVSPETRARIQTYLDGFAARRPTQAMAGS